MWHARSLIFVAACRIQFPDQGPNPDPLHWEHRVLATGPPGRSQHVTFCDWFLSLSAFSEFIPIVTSFLFVAESSSIVWLDHISYTHSSTVGDLGSSHFPSLMDVHVQVAVLPFSRACARGRVAGSHRGSSCYHLSCSSWLLQWSCLPCPHPQYTGCLPHPHPHLTFSVFLVLNHSSSISLWS